MRFFEEMGVACGASLRLFGRRLADDLQRRSEAAYVLFRNEAWDIQLVCCFKQAKRIGDNLLRLMNGRCQFFLNIDDEQQRLLAVDQHGRRLAENNGLVAMDQHQVFQVIAQAPGEDGFLGILAVAHHVFR